MAGARTGFAVLLILVSALVWAGCSASGDSIDDSQIISALDLKEAGGGNAPPEHRRGGPKAAPLDQCL